MKQYLEHGNIFKTLRANLEEVDHAEVFYKCLYGGKDGPFQIELNIRLANKGKKKIAIRKL